MDIKATTPHERKNNFKDFLLRRNPSKSFADKYTTYLTASLIRRVTMNVATKESIYEVDDIAILTKIYQTVKTDESNIRLHNVYSGVVSAYIKFLTGGELRKRVQPIEEQSPIRNQEH